MKVLLVIDVQKGFMIKDEYTSLNKKIEKFISNNTYDKIIFTKYKNDINKNSLFQDKIGWKKLTTALEQEFSITPPTHAIIFEKYGYGLNQKDLDYIKSLNIKSIDICGLQSEACVYAISLQIWDLNIYPNILINYVAGDMPMKDVFIKQFGGVDEKL